MGIILNKNLKNAISILIIIALTPYLAVAILNGGVNWGNLNVSADRNEESIKYRSGGSKNNSRTITVKDNNVTYELELNQYIVGLVAGQMPITYEDEAIKAQIVITRTNLFNKIGSKTQIETSELGMNYVNLTQMEKYWGTEGFYENYAKLERLVKETGNEVIKYENKLIDAPYHAISAGTTRNAEEALKSNIYPYLVSVDTKADIEAENFITIYTMSLEEMSGKLSRVLKFVPQVADRDSSGYIETIKLDDEIVSGEQFCKELGIASSNFSIDGDSKKIKITCKGRGHGLGMSQYTANKMAKEGKNYKEIISYFYKNINIANE